MNVIDANLIYYGTGLNKPPDYSKDKITQTLTNLGSFCVTDFTMMELVAHHSCVSTARKVHSYLSDIKVNYVATITPGYEIPRNFTGKDTFRIAKYADFRRQVINEQILFEGRNLPIIWRNYHRTVDSS